MNYNELVKTVGCIMTDTSMEEIKYEEGNSFVYQNADGFYERITIEDTYINPLDCKRSFLERVFTMVEEKFNEQNVNISGIIYVAEGVYVLSEDKDTAYFIQIPDCEIEKDYEVLISDFEEDND